MERILKAKSSISNIKTVIVLLAFLIITLFTGCEGYTCAYGYIYDSETVELLDSVLCKVLTGSEEQYSDSLGHYSVCNNFGGCVPKCPDIEVEFSKPGYKTKTLTNPAKNNIFLEKE